MNVLIIDTDRCGLDFACRCVERGHKVKWFRPTAKPVRDGEGFPGVEIVKRWQDHMKWAKDGLVITTANNKHLKELDRWREFGSPIFAPTFASAQLEINRKAGMDLMKSKGMNIADFKTFDSLKSARAHVMKTEQAFVFKTLGDEEDKSLSFVASDPAQMVEWIDQKIAAGMTLKGPCMLQEKIEMVAEIGVAGWMGKDGFIDGKFELSWEHKKLMPDNFGPNTGEQGTVCHYVKQDKLSDILKSFEADLVKLGHTGDININGGLDAKGEYWPFEWTCRAGWPDFYIRTAMHQGDPAKWMRDALLGKDSLKVSYDPHIGVVCAQPPYPYEDGTPDQVEGNPVFGLEEVWEHTHPAQLMISPGYAMEGDKIKKRSIFRTTGPYVLVVTGNGKTVKAARESVYGVVDKIKLPNMIVRNDVGAGLEKQLPILHKLGYAKTTTFDITS